MSRLIVLSNRVKLPNSQLAGGLAVGLYDALQQRGGIWLGWQGTIAARNAFESISPTPKQPMSNITYVTTPLTPLQYQHYYCGFANNVLWPLLHDRLDLVQEAAQDYALYQQVNALFAQQLQQMAKPDDVIWVHDYHFLSVAYHCRRLGMTNRIGFFLHIPFAQSDYWQANAHTSELITHLSYYQVIGTQTQRDKDNAKQVMASLPIGTLNQPKIDAYPIGVDVALVQQQAKTSSPKIACQSAIKTIIAVDRIDYSKGILERLAAFEAFLHRYPAYQGRIQLHQVACPSRLDLPTYQRLHQAVKQRVADINAQLGTPDWQPIVYDETVIAHDKLMGMLASSDICWVNSLKDGMNLIAKEYIAAQTPDHAGVLLLSYQAGAAEQMSDALLIDPYDADAVIEQLLHALTMSLPERQQRHAHLIAGLRQQDLTHWQQRFLHDLYSCY